MKISNAEDFDVPAVVTHGQLVIQPDKEMNNDETSSDKEPLSSMKPNNPSKPTKESYVW